MKITRRMVNRIVLGAPIAGALAGAGALFGVRTAAAQEATATPAPDASGAPDAAAEPEEPPIARFLAKQDDLTSEEKRRVRRDVTSFESSLKEIRDFPLGNDVPPAGSFRPLRSRTSPR